MCIFFQTATKRRVELPRQISCCDEENASVVVSRSVHLCEKFCLDTIVMFGGAVGASAAHRLDFIIKYGRLLATGVFEYELHQSSTVSAKLVIFKMAPVNAMKGEC
jgi:hypothetical protein